MNVISPDGGNLQIKMPKTILDLLTDRKENVTDLKFTVLINGVETRYEEIPVRTSDQQGQVESIREISVFIPQGDQTVEILGQGIS